MLIAIYSKTPLQELSRLFSETDELDEEEGTLSGGLITLKAKAKVMNTILDGSVMNGTRSSAPPLIAGISNRKHAIIRGTIIFILQNKIIQ